MDPTPLPLIGGGPKQPRRRAKMSSSQLQARREDGSFGRPFKRTEAKYTFRLPSAEIALIRRLYRAGNGSFSPGTGWPDERNQADYGRLTPPSTSIPVPPKIYAETAVRVRQLVGSSATGARGQLDQP